MSGDVAFISRLSRCAEKAGSLYALAKKAGLGPATVRKYLRGSEPSRPFLVAIARAAGVSLDWLCAGTSPDNSDTVPSGLQTVLRARIQRLLAEMAAAGISLEDRFKIPPERLNGLRRGEIDANASELAELGKHTPLALLLQDSQIVDTPKEVAQWIASGSYTELARFTQIAELGRELTKDLDVLSAMRFVAFRVNSEAMEPRVKFGELVIADVDLKPNVHEFGTCLVRDGKYVFVANVYRDLKRVLVTFENPNVPQQEHPVDNDPGAFEIIGRVVKTIGIRDLEPRKSRPQNP